MGSGKKCTWLKAIPVTLLLNFSVPSLNLACVSGGSDARNGVVRLAWTSRMFTRERIAVDTVPRDLHNNGI